MGQGLYRYRVGLTAVFGALLVTGAILAGTSASADQGDRDAATAPKQAAAGQFGLDPLLALRDRFVGDIARELGEDPARVQGAVRTVIDRWLGRWTRAGLLTRRQATALLGCWDGERCTLAALMRAP
jgi:hypothetical protein